MTRAPTTKSREAIRPDAAARLALESPPQAEADTTTSSPDSVFFEVVNGLYDGRYVPGQKLIESDLTQRLKVSRSSVREALRRLASEGVVTLTPHRGAHIRMLSRREVRDTLLLAEVLIGLGARLAAENIDAPGARGELRASCERLVAASQRTSFTEFQRARKAFYDTMLQVAENQELAKLLPAMHLVRIQFRAFSLTGHDVRLEYYQQITNAMLAGDAVKAEKVGRAHIRRFLTTVETLPDEAFRLDF